MGAYLKKITALTSIFLSASAVGWILFADMRSELAGLMLGSAVGTMNLYYLSFKIRQLSDLAISNSGKRFNLGFLTRASIAVLAVMFAYKSEHIDLISLIFGLFLVPIVSLLLVGFLIHFSKDKSGSERGEK
jgi:ATP synthase protein I